MYGSKTVNRSLHGGPIAIITFHDFICSDLDVNYARTRIRLSNYVKCEIQLDTFERFIVMMRGSLLCLRRC